MKREEVKNPMRRWKKKFFILTGKTWWCSVMKRVVKSGVKLVNIRMWPNLRRIWNNQEKERIMKKLNSYGDGLEVGAGIGRSKTYTITNGSGLDFSFPLSFPLSLPPFLPPQQTIYNMIDIISKILLTYFLRCPFPVLSDLHPHLRPVGFCSWAAAFSCFSIISTHFSGLNYLGKTVVLVMQNEIDRF